ncbi:MAG: DUF6602 domain-containing protein [Methylobacter sp.]
MIIDAEHVIALAEQQSKLEHSVLKGRFRELLVDGILEPWLPPTMHCVTGTVVSFRNIFRSKTQEDILLIDRSISPAVLIKTHVQEGVYLRNSVLARIEVKSTLRLTSVEDFQISCREFRELGLDLTNEQAAANKIQMPEINILFAFKSSTSKATTFSWFSSVKGGSISVVCVPEHGLWKIDSEHNWQEYQCQTSKNEAERLAAFVGVMSNTSFSQHIAAQGRDWLSTLEGGIGQYFNHWKPATM